MAQMHDEDTLAFYDREAAAYAGRKRGAPARLQAFLEQMRPRARILELGCGGGQDAELMIAAGFEVTPTDGSAGLGGAGAGASRPSRAGDAVRGAGRRRRL